MLFPTFEFAIFFLFIFYVSWELYYYSTARKVFLLLASYFFYATLDIKFLPLLVISPTLNFLFGLWIGTEENKKVKKAILIFTVFCNLLCLGLFKYYDFFIENLVNFLSLNFYQEQIPYLNFTLPLGISFFTFQGISYLVDIYRGELTYKNSLIDVLLFISFFPHLVAGPIVKANEFIPQLKKPANPLKIPFFYGVLLIFFGFFKKIIIANYLGTEVVDPIFENPKFYSFFDIIFAMYSYSVQIYCDFSAYSDMAIGFATLLGYEFPINFNQPYQAVSLQDFWRRWHISLSSWLKNYLYIPLGGNKKGELKNYRNLFITMFLGGLWHGASWNFLLWGSFHGLGLSVEKFYRSLYPQSTSSRVKKYFYRFCIFNFVSFTWIFFRSPTIEKSFEFITRFFSWNPEIKKVNLFYLSLVFLGLSFHYLKPVKEFNFQLNFAQSSWPQVVFILLIGLVVTLITAMAPEGMAPFIYFRF